jgi:hypothetical protein
MNIASMAVEGQKQEGGSVHIALCVKPGTKQTTNVLVKRGKELHARDRMYLNPSQIILVEIVVAGE